MTDERKIYSLTQLNQSLENHFFKHFAAQDFWITAELVKINQKSGHFYIELADSVNEQVTAKTMAIIWASRFKSIVEEIGLNEARGILQPGNKILMNVKIEYHSVYGLKLKIRTIDPTYSYGEIERKRKAVIEKLKAQGIFEKQKAVKLPTIIKRIALIGSPNTSGYRDFLNELFNNHDFHNFKLKEFPVSVQGAAAVDGIVNAIKEAEQYDADVIVLLRGGGSKMDLSLFDDYEIAEAICKAKLPVLTGIGHETDEVVADLVARLHFITPTAVGQYIQYEIKSFFEILREYKDKSIRLSLQSLVEIKDEFHHLKNYVQHYSREVLHYWRNDFQDLTFNLHQLAKNYLFLEKDELHTFTFQLVSSLKQFTLAEKNELNHRLEYLGSLAQQQIDREHILLNEKANLLDLLNPLKILAEGYTISTINQIDLKDIEVEIGTIMQTLSANQFITSKVIDTKKIVNEDNRENKL